MSLAAAGFGHDLVADQEAELDADPREADPLPASFGAGCDVVVARQLAALHAGAVVDRRERAVFSVAFKADLGGAGVQSIGHDLGENRFLERARIGVAQIFEEVLQINARFTH